MNMPQVALYRGDCSFGGLAELACASAPLNVAEVKLEFLGLIAGETYYLRVNDYSATGTPNWVSWHLSTAWKGAAPRCDCFSPDTTLPSGFYRVATTDYTNSGFDRGHICPSAVS